MSGDLKVAAITIENAGDCAHCLRPIVDHFAIIGGRAFHKVCAPRGRNLEQLMQDEMRELRAELAEMRNILQPLRFHVELFRDAAKAPGTEELRTWYAQAGRHLLAIGQRLGWDGEK